VQRIAGEGIIFRPTKTARSRRTIGLSAATLDFLSARRQEDESTRTRRAEADGERLVFTQEHSGPYEPVQISHAFSKLVSGSEFEGLRFHDLRHTAATLMLSQNVHPKIVSERLGHASVHITLDTYSHVLPHLQDEAAAAMDRILDPARYVQQADGTDGKTAPHTYDRGQC